MRGAFTAAARGGVPMIPVADLARDRSLYARLLRYVWPYRYVFALAILAMLINAGVQPLFADIMRQITDQGFVERNPEFIRRIPWILMSLFLVRAVSGFVDTYCIRWVGRKVISDLRRQMFERLVELPSRFYSNHSSARLVSKFVYDTEQVSTAATQAVTIMVRDTATIIGLLAYLAYLNWHLTITFIVVAPVLAFLVRYANRRLRSASREIQRSIGIVADVVKEMIQGHRIVKTFGGQRFEEQAFESANEANRRHSMRKALAAATAPAIIELMSAGAIAYIIFIATQPERNVTPGEFVAFLSALLLMMAAGRRLSKIMEPIQMGLAAAHSVFDLVDEEGEPDTGDVHVDRLSGHIEYRGVEFHYGSKKKHVLHDINFTIEPGETVALVGPSGSGKSSIAALLARFYDPDAGEIRIDGHDLRDVVLPDLRRNLSVVTQETILFNTTVARNIAYGFEGEIPRERLLAAATAAHVMDFVEALPEGLDSEIGELGMKLSGGQRQRIAIARALFKDAPILILDEATSALDAESERHVQAAIDALISNRTTLVIAHRLSTIEHADRILVLREGRIVESGDHAQLMNGRGHYWRSYQAQFGGSAQ